MIRKLSAILYCMCGALAIRHAYKRIRRGAVNPIHLGGLVQISLAFDFNGKRPTYVITDATVIHYDYPRMKKMLEYLREEYRFILDDKSGLLVRLTFRGLPFLELSEIPTDGSSRWTGSSYVLTTLNNLPFDTQTSRQVANIVRRMLGRSRIEAI